MRAGAVAGGMLLGVGALHAVATVDLLRGVAAPVAALNGALLAVELLLIAFAALLLASLRGARLPPPVAAPPGAVDVVIPLRNEPIDVLRATLRAARAMRSPEGGFRVVVADDSDAEHAADVARACREAGVAHVARPARRGYKAGALNDALATSRAPFVAVLDVDHVPEKDFLVAALRHMAPGVAYVQMVVAWRNADSLLRRLAAMLQVQFYYGVQVEKASRERAVFTGSAAVFRREALDAVGGFPEETLVEDFDLTMRLCAAGWRARFAPSVGARGLLPWSARDLARQLWRWSHGTTEAVRLRARELLASKRAPLAPRVELLADGCAYVAGGTIVAAALLLVATSLLAIPVVRPMAGYALLLAPMAVAGAHVTSAALALRRARSSGLRLLPLYHVVSLAFTPVLLVGSLAGLAGWGRRHEGRVHKRGSAAPTLALRAAVATTAALGALALVVAVVGGLTSAAAAWVAVLGVAFTGAATALPGGAASEAAGADARDA